MDGAGVDGAGVDGAGVDGAGVDGAGVDGAVWCTEYVGERSVCRFALMYRRGSKGLSILERLYASAKTRLDAPRNHSRGQPRTHDSGDSGTPS